jgi:hypothetical protein
MLTMHSNEAKIERTLKQLGCAAQNFCKIAGVGLTRFLQALNAVPGKHLSDHQAAHLLEALGEMYELQLDVDAITGTHIPINFARLDAVVTALTIRRVAKIAEQENDHTLGFAGSSRNHSIDGAEMKSCMIDLNKPCVSEMEIVDIAIDFLFDGRPMSECRGYLLSEYNVNAGDLCLLLERAQREVRDFEMEFGTRLRF